MGRLDDILERNRDPKAAAKKVRTPKPDPSVSSPVPSPPEDRLANILERNRKPKGRQGLSVGIGMALFLLFVIGLMVFTDLGLPKGAPRTSQPAPSPQKLDGEKRVNNVQLR